MSYTLLVWLFMGNMYWIDRESRNVVKIKKEDEDHGSTVQAAIDDLSDMIVVDTMKTTGMNISFLCSLFLKENAINRW